MSTNPTKPQPKQQGHVEVEVKASTSGLAASYKGPEKSVFKIMAAAGVLIVVLGGVWWFVQRPEPPTDPVTGSTTSSSPISEGLKALEDAVNRQY